MKLELLLRRTDSEELKCVLMKKHESKKKHMLRKIKYVLGSLDIDSEVAMTGFLDQIDYKV